MKTSKNPSVGNLLWKAWLVVSLLSLVGVTVVLAASGDLDATFHGTGKYKLNIVSGQSNWINAVAVRSDGKIVALGETRPSSTNRDLALLRFTSMGMLDTTFNVTGTKVIDLGTIEEGMGLVISPGDNRMIVAGQKCDPAYSTCDLLVLRFNQSGSLDTTFNGTGKRIDDFGGDDNGSLGGVALQPDGKIVVAGYMYSKITKTYEFAVHRYTQTGALDTTFAGTGKKVISIANGRNDIAYAVAIQPADGKIVVAGETCDAFLEYCNFALARLTSSGALDPNFSGDGKQITDIGYDDSAYSIALQPNGKIIAAGESYSGTYHGAALARYNLNGSLDTSFAGSGKLLLDLSETTNSWATQVRFEPGTRRIVVCGPAGGDFGLARLTSDGFLDVGFHNAGRLTVDFGGEDGCGALAIQPADGKYLLAGWSYNGKANQSALARVLP